MHYATLRYCNISGMQRSECLCLLCLCDIRDWEFECEVGGGKEGGRGGGGGRVLVWLSVMGAPFLKLG